jgi:hypothetical protein
VLETKFQSAATGGNGSIRLWVNGVPQVVLSTSGDQIPATTTQWDGPIGFDDLRDPTKTGSLLAFDIYRGISTAADMVAQTYFLDDLRIIRSSDDGVLDAARIAADPGVTVAMLPPTVLAAPSDRSVTHGTMTSFTVGAAGAATLSYRWQSAPAATSAFTDLPTTIPSATTTTLTIPAARSLDGTRYRCRISNANGAVASTAAILTVPMPAAGNTNGDKHVNLADLAQVTSQFGQKSIGLLGDINGDGSVNTTDLTAVTGAFGKSYP